MRKIYYRRFLLLPILFFCCIVLIITFLSLIPNSILFPCAKNSLDSSSTIPPNYLLVPYREFVLRTSISCQSYKLATPQKRSSQLHPSHSPYLRGTFPYVVPNSNITFNDVEEFYTKILVNKSNTTDSIDTSFAENITFENIPYKFRHDMWHPIGITSAQRTAILIPLQGRDYNAKTFIFNIHAFARRQLLTYQLFLIEQISPLGHRFNKGRLFNAAIRYIREETALNITCLILHDVDLIPEHDGNFYSCEPNHPKHTTIHVRPVLSTQSYTRFYEFLIGGVLLLSFDMYQNVNGFSNSYWGWGGEDDDLSLRFIERRMCVVRPNNETAIYAALPHIRGEKNHARFDLLTWSTIRLNTDGYAQIAPMIQIISIRKSATIVHLKYDVDANHTVYQPPSLEKFLFRINDTHHYITSSRKPITMTTPTVPKTVQSSMKKKKT